MGGISSVVKNVPSVAGNTQRMLAKFEVLFTRRQSLTYIGSILLGIVEVLFPPRDCICCTANTSGLPYCSGIYLKTNPPISHTLQGCKLAPDYLYWGSREIFDILG